LDEVTEFWADAGRLLLDKWTKFGLASAPMPLQAAIAGTGFIGRVHARSLRLAGAELAGVAASSAESATAAAAELGADRAFDSADELVRDPDVDVVHICTPNNLHLPLAEAALAAGKHVICEKPLAVDAAGAQRLADAASGSGLQAAVPFVYRYYPTVREARERVRDGRLGALHLLHGAYLQDWLLRPDDTNWRVDDELGGASRAFADIGSHWCDLAEFVSGHRITRLSARLLTTVPERAGDPSRRAFGSGDGTGAARPVATEDAALVQFETDSGALGSVVVSQVSAGRKNRLWIEFDGGDGAVAFDQEHPEELWHGTRESLELLRRDPAELSAPAARYATLPAGHPQGYADCFDAFVADVYEAVRGGALPEGTPTFADGLRAALITDAVLASARDGQWVDVQPSHAAQAVGS
jgi:predicted dehydrogenase